MFRHFLIVQLLLLFTKGGCLYSQVQNLDMDNSSNFNIVYNHEVGGKVYAYTRGYGINFHRSKKATVTSSSFYEIDARVLKHPKEVKQAGSDNEKKRYVYGKINSVFVLGGNVGVQNVLFTKPDAKAVEVRYSYSVGPLLAFLKPYYIRIYRNGMPRKNPVLFKFDEGGFTSDSGQVAGRAPFSHGLSEAKIYPGINAKFNLSFEYAPYSNLVRAIETGISVDYYPKGFRIMYLNSSENLIVTIHIGLVFGRKWY